MRVDGARRLEDGAVVISDHETWEQLPLAAHVGPPAPRTLPLCCGSLVKYAAVATGRAAAFVQHPVPGVESLKAWDHAAGVVVVEEAGGRVSDVRGGALDLSGRLFAPEGGFVVVTNGAVHEQTLAALREAGDYVPADLGEAFRRSVRGL